jgi:uncharacterized Zn finger protein
MSDYCPNCGFDDPDWYVVDGGTGCDCPECGHYTETMDDEEDESEYDVFIAASICENPSIELPLEL